MCLRWSCIRKEGNWQRLTTKFDFENESTEGPLMITWAGPCLPRRLLSRYNASYLYTEIPSAGLTWLSGYYQVDFCCVFIDLARLWQSEPQSAKGPYPAHATWAYDFVLRFWICISLHKTNKSIVASMPSRLPNHQISVLYQLKVGQCVCYNLN